MVRSLAKRAAGPITMSKPVMDAGPEIVASMRAERARRSSAPSVPAIVARAASIFVAPVTVALGPISTVAADTSRSVGNGSIDRRARRHDADGTGRLIADVDDGARRQQIARDRPLDGNRRARDPRVARTSASSVTSAPPSQTSPPALPPTRAFAPPAIMRLSPFATTSTLAPNRRSLPSSAWAEAAACRREATAQ